MTDKLKPCPCGKTPNKLGYYLTQGTKWMSIYGDCCGDWMVEGRTLYKPEGSGALYALAIESWNDTPRNAHITKIEKAIEKIKEQIDLWDDDIATNRPDYGGAHYRRLSIREIIDALKSEALPND